MGPRRQLSGAVLRIFILTLLLHGRTALATDDACQLLTTAELNKELGVTFRPGESMGAVPKTVCGWLVSDPPKPEEPRVVVAFKSLENFNAGKGLEGYKHEPAPGVGDEARYATAGGLGTTLNVRKGNRAFSVKIIGGKLKEPDVKQHEKNLALLILPRL